MYDNSSMGEVDVEKIITAATCKLYELKRFYNNRKIQLKTRIQFLESLVRSKLTYGRLTWSLTKRQFDKLESAYVGFQRHVIRGGHQREKNMPIYQRKDGTDGEFSKYIYYNETRILSENNSTTG